MFTNVETNYEQKHLTLDGRFLIEDVHKTSVLILEYGNF